MTFKILVAGVLLTTIPNLYAQRPGELPAGLPPSVINGIKSYVDIPSSVKDFSCDIQFADSPGKVIEGQFRFKSPDKVRFQAKNNTSYDSSVQGMMTRQLFPTAAFPFFLSILPPINWSESKDASGAKAQGKVVEDGKTVGNAIIEMAVSGAISKFTIAEAESPGGASPETIEIRFGSQNRNGKLLLTSVEARNGSETLRWDWEYATVGDAIVVSKATSTNENGQRQVSTCSNYKINSGLSDSLF